MSLSFSDAVTEHVISYDEIRQIHREASFVDVHAHLPLKLRLYDWDPETFSPSTTFFNPFSFRTGLGKLKAGEVPVLWATHHVPEELLLDDSIILRLATSLGPDGDKLLHGTPLERLEGQVAGLEGPWIDTVIRSRSSGLSRLLFQWSRTGGGPPALGGGCTRFGR